MNTPNPARNDPSPCIGRGYDDDGESDQDVSVSSYEDDDEDNDDDNDDSEGNDDGCWLDPSFSWIEHMYVRETSTTSPGEPKTVAHCKACMVRRGRVCDDFYREIGSLQESYTC